MQAAAEASHATTIRVPAAREGSEGAGAATLSHPGLRVCRPAGVPACGASGGGCA